MLPQSLLASRDAAAIRARIDDRASMIWSWWVPDRVFDAQVHTCAVAFEFRPDVARARRASWSQVVTQRSVVPDLVEVAAGAGTLGDRARLNANFRDEYYGLIPAVGDHPSGPEFVTSGLIDPGVSLWGRQAVTFAKQRWQRPRVDVARLDPKMQEWARRRLVPKVLVANQTQIVEAVCDPGGEWLPGVPVVAAYPTGAHWDDENGFAGRARRVPLGRSRRCSRPGSRRRGCGIAGAGTGLSANSIRLSPVVLAELPWPEGDIGAAVERATTRRRADLRVGDRSGVRLAPRQAHRRGGSRYSIGSRPDGCR